MNSFKIPGHLSVDPNTTSRYPRLGHQSCREAAGCSFRSFATCVAGVASLDRLPSASPFCTADRLHAVSRTAGLTSVLTTDAVGDFDHGSRVSPESRSW